MKKSWQLLILGIVVIFITTSCQKQYERPDVTLNPSGGGTTGGGSSNSGSLLTKMVVATAGITATYEYTYDANNQVSTVVSNSMAGTQALFYSWTFTRDNAGKMTQYLLKTNIPGFPASGVIYTAHYPAGSAYFDYLRADYSFGGLATKDSIVCTVVGGKMTKFTEYGDYGNSGVYDAVTGANYTYDANGNVVVEETLEDTGGITLQVTGKNEYTFDDKVNPLQLGQEAFIIAGPRHYSKNNFIKQVNTNFTVTPSVQSTLNYTLQYNSLNKPVSSIATDPAGGPSATTTYTY